MYTYIPTHVSSHLVSSCLVLSRLISSHLIFVWPTFLRIPCVHDSVHFYISDLTLFPRAISTRCVLSKKNADDSNQTNKYLHGNQTPPRPVTFASFGKTISKMHHDVSVSVHDPSFISFRVRFDFPFTFLHGPVNPFLSHDIFELFAS